MDRLSSDIAFIKGVGPKTKPLYTRLGLLTVADMINNYPRKYEDYSQLAKVNQIDINQPITLKVKLSKIKGRWTKARLHITEAMATDSSGSVQITWFNQPYRANSLLPNQEYFVSGKVDLSGQKLGFVNPNLMLAKEGSKSKLIYPVYRETKGLANTKLRQAYDQIKPLFELLQDDLPDQLLDLFGLRPLHESLFDLHYPKDSSTIEVARFELGVRELFNLALSSRLLKKQIHSFRTSHVPISEQSLQDFATRLSFQLTDLQRAIIWQIVKEMSISKWPINRLVEGDVGSGKTVVAAMVIANMLDGEGQAVVMAPTEILAAQHYQSFTEMFGYRLNPDQIVYLSGSLTSSDKKLALDRIAKKKTRIIIGTHAVFQAKVKFDDLRLVVIDEQHRFGVKQRRMLLSKSELAAHVITLTATPIPRSLALTLYGELDISVLSEKPPGRQVIETSVHRYSDLDQVLNGLVQKLSFGYRAYIVCPKIIANGTSDSIEEVEVLLRKNYPDLSFGILHGKMTSEAKEQAMQAFKSGKVNLLVATTVIEVGVHVDEALHMIILSPESFGLAQLHQLRGRVGRGKDKGYCQLVMKPDSTTPKSRLQYFARESDGFKLSEYDLQLRGPGALYGLNQSGVLDLKIAEFNNPKQIKTSIAMANAFIDAGFNLLDYPALEHRIKELQKIINLN